jgi:hypothetical protein
MRKAIQLTIKLWIEGEDEPAHDFAQFTMQVVREIIAAGHPRHPQLRLSVKKIAEDTRDPDEDE